MYHYEGGRKYVGEKFSMAKAKEVCVKDIEELSHNLLLMQMCM